MEREIPINGKNNKQEWSKHGGSPDDSMPDHKEAEVTRL